MFNLDEKKDRISNRKERVLFLAVQESRQWWVFTSDVVTHDIYLSLTLDTAKLRQ